MYHIYHFVPYCRRCDSTRTAYAIPTSNDPERNVIKHLKKGEYIFESDDRTYNCVCLECGVFWKDEISTQILNDEQFKIEKANRGITATNDDLDNIQCEPQKDEKPLKNKKLSKSEKIKQKTQQTIKNAKIFLGL